MEPTFLAKLQAWRSHHIRAYRWVIFSTVTIGTFMVNVDSSIVSVALPTWSEQFQAGPDALQWVMTAYLLVITALLPTTGYLSDVYGRKRFFLLGIGTFTFGSLLCACAPALLWLILARVVQGVGASMIMGNVLSIVTITFPPGERGRPLGMVGSVVATGTLTGPLLGGLLLKGFGWPAIFWVNLPFGLLALTLGSVVLDPMRNLEVPQHTLDWQGGAFFGVGILALVLAIVEWHAWGWYRPQEWLCLAVAVAALSLFWRREQRVEVPLITLAFFRIPEFTLGNLTNGLCYVIMMFPLFILPLLLHAIGMSEVHMGGMMAIQPVVTLLLSPLSGRLADRINKPLQATAAMACTCAALLCLSTVHPGVSGIWLATAIGLFGVGIAFFTSPNNLSVMESVPPQRSGLAGGILALTRNFGRVSGVSLASLVLSLGMHGETGNTALLQAGKWAFWFAALLAALAAVISSWRLRTARRAPATVPAALHEGQGHVRLND
ncbi:MAG: MFS transporter [Alicyclobacillus sp.]|nr:MFS transporter [Alicyclobacillus sp.]